MIDLAVYPTHLLNITEWKGLLSYRRRLFRNETLNFVFGVCDYMYPTVRPLTLNFALGMNSDCLRIVTSQYQGLNDDWEEL